MTEPSDRDRWNARYRDGAEGATPLLLGRELHRFPRSGRALDVAGGTGQAGAILAARGLSVTVADVSDVALAKARDRAESSNIELTTVNVDLATDPLPTGPWDVITCFNYLNRELFPAMVDGLATGGLLAVNIATRTNLERNERPSPRFLLDDGELPGLLGDLVPVHYREGWNLEGRHCAEVIAKRL